MPLIPVRPAQWCTTVRDQYTATVRKALAIIQAPRLRLQAATSSAPATSAHAPTDVEYDAVVIGSGMGGLTTATQLAAKGMRNVLVLEKYAHDTLVYTPLHIRRPYDISTTTTPGTSSPAAALVPFLARAM